MRNLLLFGLLIVSILGHSQTNVYSNYEVYRIEFASDKRNSSASQMPRQLLKAYCEGNLKAYFPYNFDKECSYHEFMEHFYFGTTFQSKTLANKETVERTICPETFCNFTNDEIEPFSYQIDLIQEHRFDRNMSRQIVEVKYVLIKYIKMVNNQRRIYLGPIFKMEDIMKLPTQYEVLNPMNTAENFSIKQLLTLRYFSGWVVETPQSDMPQTKRPDNRRKTEENMWNN